MNKLFKSKKVSTFIGLSIIALIIFLFVSSKLKSGKTIDNKVETPLPEMTYNNLKLGSSTRNDIIKEIGQPQNEVVEDNRTIIEYTTKNPNFNDQFVVDGSNLNFIKKIITIEETIRTTDMDKKYGSEEKILYGVGSGVGLYLYCYPSKGVAYLGHKNSGYMTEIWYFEPTSYETFKEKFAKDFEEILFPS